MSPINIGPKEAAIIHGDPSHFPNVPKYEVSKVLKCSLSQNDSLYAAFSSK